MKIKEIMTKEFICVNKNEDLKHVMDLMKKHNISKIPVMDGEKLVGIVTDNKIADKLGSLRSRGIPPSRMHASSVMDKKFEAIYPEMDVKEILATVGKPGLTMLPVVENGLLVGVVTKADLLPFVKGNEKVKEIMSTDVYSVKPDDRVIHARRILFNNDIARLPVVDDGKVVGILSDEEIAFALSELKKVHSLGHQNHRIRKIIVRDVMKTPAIIVNEDITVEEAAAIMMKNEIGCVPIVGDDEKIKGIVTRTDLVRLLTDKL
ncbi:MAG: CBS domain-containing protein [Candidatus Thermoplasmatota archaeon]|nr:CBS domain-containing protein [Candidatus Thermoplasmatota archaeon]